MRVAGYAPSVFVAGGIFGLVGYWCVFVFTNVLDGLAERLDIEESYIFFGALLACAIFGSILSIGIALIRARR